MTFGLTRGFHENGSELKRKKSEKVFYILFHGFDLADQVIGVSFGYLHMWTARNNSHQLPIPGYVHVRPM